jgi:hypothetical protein
MPCCGKKRSQARPTTQTPSVPESAESASLPRPPEHDSLAYFQYLGKTGLTVMGPRTGKRYRFHRPGTVVAVDPRDRHALAAVSILRQVAKPREAIHPG